MFPWSPVMRKRPSYYRTGFLLSCAITLFSWLPAQTLAASQGQEFTTIEWPDLIPDHILEILLNPPEYITETEDGSAEDRIESNIKNALAAATDDPYQQALSSTEVKAEMNGVMIRLPGFVVPLEFDENQVITQFFLVPYFGACLHMPPPPPNQIVLVDSPQGLTLDELYTPLWISGALSTTVTENDMATSAYSMKMVKFELYQ